ncbi:MAG: hypothetical protein ABIK65_00555 [Candidatus Eisenbacteria bacterium]
MLGFRYSEWDPELVGKLAALKDLLDLFHFLLLKTNGDPEQALDLMKYLQGKGYVDAEVDLDEFLEELEHREIVSADGRGRRALTGKGVRGLRRSSLESVFRSLKAGSETGGHRTPYGGGSQNDALPERREYRFGDDLESIDFSESLWNAVRRDGTTDTAMDEADLVIYDREFGASSATVLLLDISHSMVLYGEDRFTPAKQVALALTELILTRYRRDTLDVVLFGDEAAPAEIADLPFASVGPFHTNTKSGLALARRILDRRKNPNKQIFMVTDGKPTVIDLPGGQTYRNTWGTDERILNRTLDEAVACRRRGIVITTFMVARDRFLQRFVERLTELNRGRAYFSTPDDLGSFVLVDFIRNRRSRRGPGT